jgi:hypothetical protein
MPVCCTVCGVMTFQELGKFGDGYDGRQSPHTKNELFAGLSLEQVTQVHTKFEWCFMKKKRRIFVFFSFANLFYHSAYKMLQQIEKAGLQNERNYLTAYFLLIVFPLVWV